VLGRTDCLKKYHMRHCQPELDKDETGFLLDGELPLEEVEYFRAILKIIGGTEKR